MACRGDIVELWRCSREITALARTAGCRLLWDRSENAITATSLVSISLGCLVLVIFLWTVTILWTGVRTLSFVKIWLKVFEPAVWFSFVFFPQKTGAVSLLVGGWAVCLYLLHWVFDNFLSMQYKKYLLGYFVIATVISFAVCYWYGPVTNNRTMYLIQLFLQLIGLLCIYNGSQHEGSTMVIIVVIVMLRWIPSCGRPVGLVAAALG